MRSADGVGDLSLPTWAAFASTELLDQLALERMLAKLSTRRYHRGLEPVGSQVERTATGTSKAAVSLLTVAGINVYDIMRSDKLVLTAAAVKAIEARLS